MRWILVLGDFLAEVQYLKFDFLQLSLNASNGCSILSDFLIEVVHVPLLIPYFLSQELHFLLQLDQ